MNKLVLLFFSLSLVACHSVSPLTEDTTFRHYDKMWRSSGKLVLKKDGTFNYKYAIGLIEAESRGQWSQQAKGRILMTSDSSYKVGYMAVRELGRSIGEDHQISLKIVDRNRNKLVNGISVRIDGEEEWLSADEEGKVILKDRNIKGFTINYYVDSFIWKFETPPQQDLEIEIVPEDLGKTYFDQEVWIKKAKRLITPDGKVFKKKSS